VRKIIRSDETDFESEWSVQPQPKIPGTASTDSRTAPARCVAFGRSSGACAGFIRRIAASTLAAAPHRRHVLWEQSHNLWSIPMTKLTTAADDTRNAADDAKRAATNVAVDAKNAAADAGNEVAERTIVGFKEASARAVSMNADTQKSMGENMEKFSHRLQGLSSFNQHNLEAFARSSEISAKALESIGSEVAAYTKKSYEDQVAAAQDISTAKTVAELVEKQTSFAQHAFEGWAQQAVKLSAIYTSAAKDIAAPLGERFSAATEEMKSVSR
jgi:phasin family protein